MKRLLLLTVVLVSLAACERGDDNSAHAPTSVSTMPPDLATPNTGEGATRTVQPTSDLDPSAQGIYLLNVDAGTIRRATTGFSVEATWTPDGAELWYATGFYPGAGGSGSMQIRAINVASGTETEVYEVPGGGFASIAPAARRAAFVRHVGGVVDPDDPQGGRVEYSVHVIDESGERSLGSGLRALLDPAGSMLAFETPACGNSPSLALIDLDTGARIDVDHDIDAFSLRTGADGRFLYDARGVTYVVLDASGTTAQYVVHGVEPEHLGSLAPNLRVGLIEYLGHVFVRDLSTEAQFELPAGTVRAAAWPPDSTMLAYATDDSTYVVSIPSSSVVHEVPRRAFGGLLVKSMAWSPKGDEIAIEAPYLLGHGICT